MPREHLLDAADVAQVRADTEDHADCGFLAPAFHGARASCLIVSVEPDEHRLADQEMPDIEFDDFGAVPRSVSALA